MGASHIPRKIKKETTQMKTTLKKLTVVVLTVFIGLGTATMGFAADWVTTNHAVTVQIPEVLSISADASSFTLPFQDYITTGEESWAQTVIYTVQSNNMRQADASPAINANLDFAYDRLELKAEVGAFSKTSGNTEIAAQAAGFVTVGTNNVTLAKKTGSTIGGDGKLLNGSIPITYKAVATDNVPSGDQTHTLYITLTTI